MTHKSSLKVSVSGVRGIVGDSLTPGLVADFAASFGRYVGGGRVVVGRDTRTTGQMLEKSVIAGLLSVGCQPVLIGIVPTPTVQIIVDKISANGGIAITASHNPAQWNAMKFIGRSGIFLNFNEAAELLDIYNQPDFEFAAEDEIRDIRYLSNAFTSHQERIFSNINRQMIADAKFKVAVDCCNGAGALYSRSFLENLGCDVVSLFDDADGNFRRNPEPIAENLTALCDLVKNESCNIGFAQDPDGDRLTVVDENGKFIGEQYSVVLAAEHILSRPDCKGKNVVVNLATTKAIEDIAAKYDSKVFYSKIGEINVINEMIARNAVIGGEGGSGGMIWPAVHPCRDSFAGMALMLELMAFRKQQLSKIMADIPQYFTANRKLPCTAENALRIVRRLRAEFANMNPITLDGLRLDWKDHWVLIRASNTEPVIRITAEALSSVAADRLADDFAVKIK